MGNTHQLQGKLKALKLGGMLDTLELRLGQAQQAHLGYVEFLEFLMEDELQRRANRRLVTRVARARFEEEKTFEGFDFTFNPKIPARQIRDLATCQFIQRKEWALFIGPVGVGKSHTVQALGHQACRMGYKVLYVKTSRLLSDLGGGHADGTWESRLRRYLQPDLLILDDFAMKEFSVQQSEDIYELVGERSRAGSLVAASNRLPQDWYPLFPNPVLAEGILDRLVNQAHHVILTGKSYRPLLRPDRSSTSQREKGQEDPGDGGGTDVK
jgi:DNA replication protein DnaC